MTKTTKQPSANQPSDRSERLKQALRANLKRRKTQAKAKKASKDEEQSSTQ